MNDALLMATGALREAYDRVDWVGAGLGALGGWDGHLRSTLQLALGTRFPVCLFWGPDLVMLYNEAYVQLIEDKHPDALGRPAEKVFPEAWPQIGPLFATAMAGQATWAQDERVLLRRRGEQVEETFFTFSYSPVLDSDGLVLGVVDIAVETTAQVVDRRRLEVLSALNFALADVLDPDTLVDPALAVLRSAPLDLPAVELLQTDGTVYAHDTRTAPIEHRLLTPPHPGTDPTSGPHIGTTGAAATADAAAALVVRDGADGPVAWVQLPSARSGTRRPVLAVLLGGSIRVDDAYRAFLGLLAATVASALDRAEVHALQQAASTVTRQLSEALQRSMLTDLPQPDHLQCHARYVPAMDSAQIGGDWYDAVVTPDGATTLIIGDVVGHDSYAAAAMGQLRAMTRTLVWAFDEPASEVLTRVDRAVSELHTTVIATALLGRIEQSADDEHTGLRRLRWSSAGHLPPLLVHPDGTAEYLTRPNDLLLGVDPTSPRQDHHAPLPPGSTLLLFTDGLVERRDQPLTEGLETLRVTAAEHADLELTALVDAILQQMTGPHHRTNDSGLGRIGAGRHQDDIVVLAVRMHPEDRPRPAEAGPSHL